MTPLDQARDDLLEALAKHATVRGLLDDVQAFEAARARFLELRAPATCKQCGANASAVKRMETEIVRLRALFRLNMARYAPAINHSQINGILDETKVYT